MRKAQMEILGLALIVMFLALGLLLVIKFVILPQKESPRTDFTQSQTAYNLVNAILETTSEGCRGMSFRDLLIDCADGPYVTCDDGTESCEFVNMDDENLGEMLKYSIDRWPYHYEFEASVPTETILKRVDDDGKGCPDEKKLSRFPLQTQTRGTMIVQLKLCT